MTARNCHDGSRRLEDRGMSFSNPSPEAVSALLRSAQTIAVVGLSDNPHRPSYEVASYLLDAGYRIVPVNPGLAVWEGIRAVASLEEAIASLGEARIDIVDVFRQSRHVAGIVDECIRLKVPALWLQMGVVDAEAATRARDAGITVVMDRCIKVERMRIE
jgi:predicted CoA-binding protein